MRYIERAAQIKTALLGRPDLMDAISTIFKDHLEPTRSREPFGQGNNRTAYTVGSCEIEQGKNVSLLLKLANDQRYMKYSDASRRWLGTAMTEFGAFETYYDFAAGHITNLSFRSQRGWQKYCERSTHPIAQTFSLDDKWGGTRLRQGDLGAVPYFQMAIRYRRTWFGCLTEGLPPLIEPEGSAWCLRTLDDLTVEQSRASVITLKPAIRYQFKTGQRDWPKT